MKVLDKALYLYGIIIFTAICGNFISHPEVILDNTKHLKTLIVIVPSV